MKKTIKNVIEELSVYDGVKEKKDVLDCMLITKQIDTTTKLKIEDYLTL